MGVGDIIKTRREELGMTQDELAERMGYKSRSTIAKIEKGVNDVTQTTLSKLAGVLSTTPAYLMGWVAEEDQKKNDRLATIVLRLRSDAEFMAAVDAIYDMEPEKLSSLLSLLK